MQAVEGMFLEVPRGAWTAAVERAVGIAEATAAEALGLPEGSVTVRLRVPYDATKDRSLLWAYSTYQGGRAPEPFTSGKAAGVFSPRRASEVWVTADTGAAGILACALHELFHAHRYRQNTYSEYWAEEREADAFVDKWFPLAVQVAGEEGGLL